MYKLKIDPETPERYSTFIAVKEYRLSGILLGSVLRNLISALTGILI